MQPEELVRMSAEKGCQSCSADGDAHIGGSRAPRHSKGPRDRRNREWLCLPPRTAREPWVPLLVRAINPGEHRVIWPALLRLDTQYDPAALGRFVVCRSRRFKLHGLLLLPGRGRVLVGASRSPRTEMLECASAAVERIHHGAQPNAERNPAAGRSREALTVPDVQMKARADGKAGPISPYV